MKKRSLSHIAAAILSLVLVQTIPGQSIIGNLGFTGSFTNNTGSVATGTQLVGWGVVTVTLTSGAFSVIPIGTQVALQSPWNYTSGALANFWQVGGFTFDLLSSSPLAQAGLPGTSGFLIMQGTGTISGNGYSATSMDLGFSAQDPAIISPNVFTFSSTFNAVPEPMTLALFGSGLSLLLAFRRKKE